ncbi:hypothetical protein [Cellulosimicrobium sp. TH-20]|uniref:hypothetical protein n=1 Tax=Cellulosimicrobium sp. TH-20 TaxID=1980001 RepID=UPI001642A60B|nr:hypothetical protein [Cellulosimicrobium sp. TH-20]
MARDDLRHAARHAARRESPRLLADVEKAKRQLAEAQHIADEHAATHVESAQVAA